MLGLVVAARLVRLLVACFVADFLRARMNKAPLRS